MTPPQLTNPTSTVDLVEFVIPEGEDVSTTTTDELYPELDEPGTSRIELLPVDVVVAFGFSPIPETKAIFDNNLRQSSACLASLGGANAAVNVFLMKGKPYQQKEATAEKRWVVLTTSQAQELKMGLAGVPFVVFNGHSNMGLGPCFDVGATQSISSFYNIGNPRAAINLPFMHAEGYPQNFSVADADVPQTMKNYTVLPQIINTLRFDNSDGVVAGGVFSLKNVAQGGARATGHHFNRGPNNRFLISDVPDTARAADTPPLGYEVFFYNSCSTARDYGEVFQHGTFICSTTSTLAANEMDELDQSTQSFVDMLIGGETLSMIYNEILDDQANLGVQDAYQMFRY